MRDLAEILRKSKVNRGYIDFELEEAKIIVNDEGEEQLTGVLDTEGDEFVLRFDRGHIDLSEYFQSGIKLQRRANTKHLQIQSLLFRH